MVDLQEIHALKAIFKFNSLKIKHLTKEGKEVCERLYRKNLLKLKDYGFIFHKLYYEIAMSGISQYTLYQVKIANLNKTILKAIEELPSKSKKDIKYRILETIQNNDLSITDYTMLDMILNMNIYDSCIIGTDFTHIRAGLIQYLTEHVEPKLDENYIKIEYIESDLLDIVYEVLYWNLVIYSNLKYQSNN